MGLHPAMAPMKRLYEEGEVAVIHGIGYENSPSFPLPLHGHLAHLRA